MDQPMKVESVPSQIRPVKELFDKYPEIFRQRHLPPAESAMHWGIECGDGWYPLLDALCDVLTSHARKSGLPLVEATQVKAKFGRLRFHISSDTADRRHWVRGAIEMASALSQYVCEETGQPGILMVSSRGWVKTLAEDYGRKHGFQPAETVFEGGAGQPAAGDVATLPPGWQAIGTTLKQIVTNSEPSASVEVRELKEILSVEIQNGTDWTVGAAACLVALAARTNSKTGVMWVTLPQAGKENTNGL
jgi:hypothetical protein